MVLSLVAALNKTASILATVTGSTSWTLLVPPLTWPRCVRRLVRHNRWASLSNIRVLFENRPALYFCNYIFITAHKLYNFGFRIKDTV